MRPLFFALLALATLTTAQAHSTLERSDPKAGAVLKIAPNELRLWFTEPLKVGLSTIEVRDAANRQVDRKDLHADATTPRLLHLSLGAKLPPGVYKVTWTAIAQDLHPSKGSFTFRVEP